jgi:hypothetical protein
MKCDKCGSELTLDQEVQMLRKRIEELEIELKTRPVIIPINPYQTATPYLPWETIITSNGTVSADVNWPSFSTTFTI